MHDSASPNEVTAPARSRPELRPYGPWVVMHEEHRQRWGGDLRRRQIFRQLARHTRAMTADGWSIRALADAMGRVPFALRALPIPFRLSRPRLASSEQLRPDMLRVIRRAADLAVVAIYDDPVSQTASLGMRMSSPKTALYTARRVGNIDAFRWHAVPTASFAALIGLDLDRAIVAGNGTDVKHIRPGPWPARPTVGMVSGAAPGRGIENLVTAAREIREEMRELRLLLWLVPTGPESEDYLTRLRLSVAADSWIEITSVDYAEISAALSQATVLAVPHPPGAYMDVALPVKVFDSMAAGRPLVITPRTETRDLVLRHAAGEVAGGDRPEDIATALVRVLNDEAAARRMGEAARAAAVEQYDWPVVGERLALEVLRREGALSAAAVFSSSSGTGALNG